MGILESVILFPTHQALFPLVVVDLGNAILLALLHESIVLHHVAPKTQVIDLEYLGSLDGQDLMQWQLVLRPLVLLQVLLLQSHLVHLVLHQQQIIVFSFWRASTQWPA